MKKVAISTLFILFSLVLFAQDESEIIEIVEETEKETVPFAVIENAPIFPGCEKLKKELQKKCMQEQVSMHVSKKFNASLASELGLPSGRTRVIITFKIGADGVVKDIRARAAHARLEQEGINVVKSLPKMTPGNFKNKPVDVAYTLPITLIVEETVDIKETEEQEIIDNKN